MLLGRVENVRALGERDRRDADVAAAARCASASESISPAAAAQILRQPHRVCPVLVSACDILPERLFCLFSEPLQVSYWSGTIRVRLLRQAPDRATGVLI